MEDDPDDNILHQAREARDPVNWYHVASKIEIHLRYGIPALKRIGWAIVVLLALIAYRMWFGPFG